MGWAGFHICWPGLDRIDFVCRTRLAKRSSPLALDIDAGLLKEFEDGLDPRNPERSVVPARVLGYGEISTTFEIDRPSGSGLAFKRMPIFENAEELSRYESIFDEYHRLLSATGIALPDYGYATLSPGSGNIVFFIVQEKLPPESIGNKAIHSVPAGDSIRLVRQVLRELSKVWSHNRLRTDTDIGIDGQISNWSVKGFDPAGGRLPDDIELIYFDTSTPLYTLNGVEQLDPELFLRSAPSFLIWLLRLLFLEDVMSRYHDFHLVAIDLIANFYKEQLPELIPELIETANDFFATEASGLGIEPISMKEVKSYYREDALIWSLYLSMRKVDRFMRNRLLRRDYPYILPGKIKRH
jgi:hypothetical protein